MRSLNRQQPYVWVVPIFYIGKNNANLKTPVSALKKEFISRNNPPLRSKQSDQIFMDFDCCLILSLVS